MRAYSRQTMGSAVSRNVGIRLRFNTCIFSIWRLIICSHRPEVWKFADRVVDIRVCKAFGMLPSSLAAAQAGHR